MTAIYATKVTQAYLNRRAAHEAGGTAINFVAGTVIVGDGNGTVPAISTLLAANGGAGGVVHEVWRGTVVNAVTVNSQTAAQIDILCVIPTTDGNGAEIGPFWVREFVITDEAGVPMVVGTTQIEKSTGADNGQTSDLAFIAAIGESNSSNVVLTPPAAGFVTQVDVYNIFNGVVPAAAEPLFRTDVTDVSGHKSYTYAVRVAPQDISKLGVTRPATDAEFAAFAANVSSLTPFPYPTLAQIKSTLQSLDPGLLHAGAETGAANAYVVPATTPVLKAYGLGVTVVFIPGNDSTGADCTLSAQGLGAVALKAADGTTTVGKGHIAAGKPAIAWHDGTRFRLLYSMGMNPQSSRWFVGSASGVSPNALTITFTGPAPAARTAGVNIRAKIATGPNTGPVTVNYGFGAIPVVLNDGGAALSGGEMPLNLEAILFDDGTSLRLVNPHVAAAVIPAGPEDGALVHRGTASGSANTITTTLSPAVANGARGFLVELTITANNTAAATVNYGEGDVAVVDNVTGAAIASGVLKSGMVAQMWRDTTGLRLMNPVPGPTIPPPYDVGTIIWGQYSFDGVNVATTMGATGSIPGLPGTWRCHGSTMLTYVGEAGTGAEGAAFPKAMCLMVRIA